MVETESTSPPARQPAIRLHVPWRRRLRWSWHWVFDNLTSLLLALIISLTIWVIAVSETNPPREDIFPSDLPIEILHKPPTLVMFQPFERTARVRIRASASAWERLQSGSARATIDLSGAIAGLHDYEVQVKFADPEITILSIDPQSVSLRLEEQRDKAYGVQVSIGDTPPVGFTVGTPQADPPVVQVSGPQSRVEQVLEVVAAVQLRGSKETVDRQVALIARDALGNTVQGVTLKPDTALVHVPVEQRLGFKDVSVRVVTKGSVASGYWVSNIAVEPGTLTVVGSPARLDEIGGFVPTEAIDIKDAKVGFVQRIGLVLPQGVSAVSTQNVAVSIDIAAITGGQTVQRQVTIRNLDRSLKATLSPDAVDVILGGPLPILQTLKLEDVQVIIDLANKQPGKYKISPIVIKPDSLKVESIVPDTIEVTISK